MPQANITGSYPISQQFLDLQAEFLKSLMAMTPTTTTTTTTTPTPSLDCQQNIPTGGPAATDIANALQKNNQLANVCAANFTGSGNSTHITFNHGYILFELERPSPDRPLVFCHAALDSIINVCILGSNDYGGVFYQGGEKYNVSNSKFPSNPLIPGADQGGPAPSNPTTSQPLTTSQPNTPTPNNYVSTT